MAASRGVRYVAATARAPSRAPSHVAASVSAPSIGAPNAATGAAASSAASTAGGECAGSGESAGKLRLFERRGTRGRASDEYADEASDGGGAAESTAASAGGGESVRGRGGNRFVGLPLCGLTSKVRSVRPVRKSTRRGGIAAQLRKRGAISVRRRRSCCG